MKKTKTLSLSILSLSALSLGILAASGNAHAETKTTIPVTVETTQQRVSSLTIDEVGKLKATDSAALTFSAGEKLKLLNFKDGDVVKKGDLIAQLDDSQAKAELDKAKSSLALAESKLDRVLALLKKQPDSMSEQDVEELRQQAKLAKADFKQKKIGLQNYQMVAPFDGQLTNFTHSLGSRVEAATVLVSLIKLDPVEVHYSISQSEVGKAKIGQPVALKVDAYGDTEFMGHVDYIAPLVDEQSGRVEIHAHFNNQDNRLVPGMFAKVSQSVGDESDDVIVSQSAIETNGDERFVWVVENDKAIKRPVELGTNTNDGYVAIDTGLEVGETVVVTGRQNLNEDSLVSIQATKSETNSTPVEAVATEQAESTTQAEPAKRVDSPVTLPARTLPAQPEEEFVGPVQPEQQETEVPETSKEAEQSVDPQVDTTAEVN
ncbi:efflux RND transporter periplasmic adaptor subunit [Vibrio maerlii]|uniref:efflux RND transporter periplasmic adaptor subunit n=1 Tax=Vibrio maerlii TaxID=2231648 RepID=UPI000E3D6024|nr:efflux RND transporter periplasmic adaptor subunit [Vibrio maerlii]